MKVTWTEFAEADYDFTCKYYPEKARIENFMITHEGEVIGTFLRGLLDPVEMFLVEENGKIMRVEVDKCKIIKSFKHTDSNDMTLEKRVYKTEDLIDTKTRTLKGVFGEEILQYCEQHSKVGYKCDAFSQVPFDCAYQIAVDVIEKTLEQLNN